MSAWYLGLSSTAHDPAVALVNPQGELVFAEALERPLQIKRAWGQSPDAVHLVGRLLEEHGDPSAPLVLASTWGPKVGWLWLVQWLFGRVSPAIVAQPRRPGLTRMMIEQYELNWLALLQFGSFVTVGATAAMHLRRLEGTRDVREVRLDHHRTHAAQACWSSPFEDAACLVVDGYGELESISAWTLRSGQLELLERSRHLGSLGFFYATLTRLCGFEPLKGEEWKVMGLAPYGQPLEEPRALLRSLMEVRGLKVRFAARSEVQRVMKALQPWCPEPGASIAEAADLAATGQSVFAEVMTELLCNLHAETGLDDLVLTGGCALNSSFNGRILERTPFQRLHVPSCPGDDGNALGAAWLAWSQDHQHQRPTIEQPWSPYTGSRFSRDKLERTVQFGHHGRVSRPPELAERVAQLLAEGALVGWVQGRAELGPRALGHRSILADPRSPGTKDRINGRVKFREVFRPFAPSILHEHGADWFEDYAFSPYMERTLRWRPEVRDRVPAVVHADGTGRLQSVRADLSPGFHALISAFHGRTGVPLLLNTSFNVMGRPMVHDVEDAVAVFHTSGLDAMVIDDVLFEKPAGSGSGPCESAEVHSSSL